MTNTFSNIVSLDLAKEGLGKIQWAKRFMPVMEFIKEQCIDKGSLKGRRVGIILTLEPKTANLAIALQEAGAKVSVFCHSTSTTDSVAAALTSLGIKVFARSDADSDMDEILLNRFLDQQLEFLIDDGAGGIRYLHEKRKDLLPFIKGVAEETTSGIRPLRVMEKEGSLLVPCVSVNDAKTKQLFDNVYGTGQSVVAALLDITNIQMQGKTVVVVGYGYVGKGIAKYAHAYGAKVYVTEVDPVQALIAVHDGYTVKKLSTMCPTADIFITATGIGYSLTSDHMRKMKDGAIIIVGGAGQPEVDLGGEKQLKLGSWAREHLREVSIGDNKSVFLIDDGHCANCSAREGNPVEIMDLSLSVQMAAILFLAENEDSLENKIYSISKEVDDLVATACLNSLGAELDEPSEKQIEHANSWKHDNII